MQATTTRCLKVYIRGGADRQLMSRLLADRARGVGYSETMRRALRHYYHLGDPPTPSNNGAADVSALANAVLLMAGQMRELSDEVARLQSEVRQMHEALKWALESDA
jgi:hypothetical protein